MRARKKNASKLKRRRKVKTKEIKLLCPTQLPVQGERRMNDKRARDNKLIKSSACVSQSWSNSSLSLRTFVSINNRKSWFRHPTGQTENLYEWIRSCRRTAHNSRIIQYIFDFFICLFFSVFSEICPTTFFFFFCAKERKKTFRFIFFCVRRKEFLVRAVREWEKHEVGFTLRFIEMHFR